VKKLAEVKAIADEVEQEAVKEAQDILKKTEGTPEVGASGSVQESVASETKRSEAPLLAKVTQIPDPPSTTHLHHHPQLILTKTTYLSVRNTTCLNPHLNLNPLQQTQAKHKIRVNPTHISTGLAEVIMGSTIQKPSSSDQSHPGSPSNLFSLEKHLGGEFPVTPQKASKSVPKKIDLVNQQLPKPSQQNNPKQTSLQTKTQAQTQKTTILESVIETDVQESVLVTEF